MWGNRSRALCVVLFAGTLLGAAMVPGATAETAPGPARVHLGARDVQADAALFGAPSISADGSRVAFASAADNLVPDDTNDAIDVFVRDRRARTTVRVSVATLGLEGLGASMSPVISADGRWVAFTSYASNLTLGDLNGITGAGSDVFVHDLATHSTVKISGPAFGLAEGESDFASISANGRYVAFDSTAANLVPGDTNGTGDVFLWDRADSSLRRVSESRDGGQADAGSGLASISADGSRVAFVSAAPDLVADDTNGYVDAFVADVRTRTVQRVNVTSDGTQAQGDADSVTLSGDGRTAAVVTAWPLSTEDKDFSFDVYTHDLRTRQTRLISSGEAGEGVFQPRASYGPALSDDGHTIVWSAGDADPSPGGPPPGSQVWLRDLRTGTARMISTAPTGSPDDVSHGAAISGDGTHVAFASSAQNLVPFDNNHASDAFVVDLGERRYAPGGPTSMPRDVYAPDTAITSGPPPAEPTPAPARFTFAADEADVRFQCRLDADPETVGENERWSTCPAQHTVLAPRGKHKLEVRAVDAAGNADDSPAQRVFVLR